LSSAGGTVRAVCTDATTARLVSWSAIKPYKTGPVDPGPGPAPTAVFRRGKSEVTMTITCAGGTPSTSNG
jgi:hypothetical protein